MTLRGCALALLLAAPALAAPPDARLLLFGKKPHFEKMDQGFLAVLVDAPGVLSAELLPTQELLLDPKGSGVAHVFLFTERLVRVIEVAVDTPLPAPPSEPPPAGCAAQEGTARIPTQACYDHWRAHLLHASVAEAPRIAFEDAGLFAELKAAQAALDQAGLALKVALTPFGLRLIGTAEDSERRKALMTVWPAILGPLRIDR